jgi:hypothetical protein
MPHRLLGLTSALLAWLATLPSICRRVVVREEGHTGLLQDGIPPWLH